MTVIWPWAVIGRFGNRIAKRTIPLELRGLTAGRLPLIRQAIAAVLSLSRLLHVPLADGTLDSGQIKVQEQRHKAERTAAPDAGDHLPSHI